MRLIELQDKIKNVCYTDVTKIIMNMKGIYEELKKIAEGNSNFINEVNETGLLGTIINMESASIYIYKLRYVCNIIIKEMVHFLLLNGANIENVKDTIIIRIINCTEHNIPIPTSFTKCIELLKFAISKGANIHSIDDEKRTALHYAAGLSLDDDGGNSLLLNFLLDQEIDVNAQDEEGKTALHIAASDQKLSLAVLKVFVDRGVNVNARDKKGKTALDYCLRRRPFNRLDVVVGLLKAGANIDKNTIIRKILQMTMFESERSSIEVQKEALDLAIAKGANIHSINALDKQGKTALDYAIQECIHFDAIAALILDKIIALIIDINAKDVGWKTASHLAWSWNLNVHAPMVNFFIERKDDINALDKQRKTALEYVIQRCIHFDAIVALINTGVSIFSASRAEEIREIVEEIRKSAKVFREALELVINKGVDVNGITYKSKGRKRKARDCIGRDRQDLLDVLSELEANAVDKEDDSQPCEEGFVMSDLKNIEVESSINKPQSTTM